VLARLIERGGGLVAADAAGGDAYMSSGTRSTAMALSALIEVAPGDKAIDKLVAGLDASRRADGRWESTEENLWGLVALADYARSVAPGDSSVTITAGGKTLGAPRVRGAGVSVIRTSLAKLAATKVELAGSGTAHYTVRVIEARRDDGAALSRGFSVTRSYLDDAGQPLKTIKAGDLITVKLTVTADNAMRWIALVDPLPAGLEVVNPRLATSADTSRDPQGNPPARRWDDVAWVHQEIHDDHVQWFADTMSSGTYELHYKARAATAGTFAALPTRIEAMYEPEIMGRTASTTLTIAP